MAHDPKTGEKIEVKYPKKRNIVVNATANKNQAVDAIGTKLAVKKDEVMRFPAPKGVIDKEALERYARMQFYHLGRGETIYTFETSHLFVDSPKGGGEINLLQLRPGSPIGIGFEPFKVAHLRDMQVGQRIDYIQALGYHLNVATFSRDRRRARG